MRTITLGGVNKIAFAWMLSASISLAETPPCAFFAVTSQTNTQIVGFSLNDMRVSSADATTNRYSVKWSPQLGADVTNWSTCYLRVQPMTFQVHPQPRRPTCTSDGIPLMLGISSPEVWQMRASIPAPFQARTFCGLANMLHEVVTPRERDR